MGALDKGFELCHAVLHLLCKIRAHVIIVADGVGGPRLALHHMGIAGCDALSAVVRGRGVLNNAGVPHVGAPQ